MKAAIPVVTTGQQNLDRFCEAVKQNMDAITGQHKNAPVLTELTSTATLADVIEQLNLLHKRID